MKDREKTKTIIKAAFFVLLIVVVPLILFLTNREFFAQFESIEDVEDFIAGYGHLSGLVYIVFQIFQVVISVIPGEVFQVAAGYLFGPFWGVIYAIIGCLLGEAVAFGLARVLGQGFVRLFMSEEQFIKYQERLNSNKAYTLCFILYLIPGIPKDILCYVAGASGNGLDPHFGRRIHECSRGDIVEARGKDISQSVNGVVGFHGQT